ncbi:MAG: tRNA (guanosine(37)-N1)-methyltransferase TrmD [Chitinophagaceae bacterium]
MHIDIISAIPELLHSPLNYSIVKRAQKKELIEISIHNLHDFAEDKYKHIDDAPYGGGAGMVLKIEPLVKAIESLQEKYQYDEIIYLTPDGSTLNQTMCNKLSLTKNLLLICGHYKGIDERIREHFITMEISIGDYVLSGGELPAAILVDSLVRLIPGVINDETSALSDSFQDHLLASPIYTRPVSFRGWKVPAILLSGHEANIAEWRLQQALQRTQQRRPDLLHK